MSESGRFRKKKSFSTISNYLIRDENISLRAKGLYALIQSYVTLDDFTLYKGYLVTKCKEGKAAFDVAWRELKTAGYLKQYRINTQDGFVYEYDLLDSPYTDFPDMENPSMESPCMGTPSMENRGDINNTLYNNTILNNNHINHIYHINDVMDMIGYDTFNHEDVSQVREIAQLMTDVLNTPDGKYLRIAKDFVPAEQVKERFLSINQFHVGYVIECMKQSKTKINNIKNYLLTALYNAPETMSTYYQNRIAVEGSAVCMN